MKAITRYSITLSFSVLLLVLIVSPASADDEYPWPEEYTIFCASEERRGLDWEKGKWEPVKFKNIQRLIMKSNKNHCHGPGGEIHYEELNVHSKNVCINERQLGEEYEPMLSSRYCEEHYIGPSPKSKIYPSLERLWIYCDQPKMFLDPNGWYHYAQITGEIEDDPEDDYKSSQYIEVGKCSMIKP